MGRPPKIVKPEIVKPQTTAITNWDEELARDAAIAADMEKNAGGGNFFSTRGGILALNDVPMPGNKMAVIITDSILENSFYEGKFDSDNITPPTCFAFGRDDATMGPHKTVVDAGQDQHRLCQGCPMNEYSTADTGRGKACSNRRRLGVISAGDYDPKKDEFTLWDDPDQFDAGPVSFLKLPPTSVKGYAAFVKQVAATLQRPPYGIYSCISVMPDPKTQFRIIVSPLGKVPNALLPVLVKRHQETKAVIEQPYSLVAAEQPAAAAKGRPGAKGAVKNVRPEVKRTVKKY